VERLELAGEETLLLRDDIASGSYVYTIYSGAVLLHSGKLIFE